MTQLTSEQLKEKMNSNENFVLDLYATWCGPCKVMLNNMEKASTMLTESQNSDYAFYKFDIDQDREFAMNELGIRSVPTVKFYKNGKEYHSKTGVMSAPELISLLN
jgi:thioredoxin 1